MRTWATLTPKEREIFTDKNEYGHLLEKSEREFLFQLEVTVWSRPLTEQELRAADEILLFVKDAELARRSAA